jgi:hypothetical protein
MTLQEMLPINTAYNINLKINNAKAFGEKLDNDVIFEMDYTSLHKRQALVSDCNTFLRSFFGFFSSNVILESLTTIPSPIPAPHFIGRKSIFSRVTVIKNSVQNQVNTF